MTVTSRLAAVHGRLRAAEDASGRAPGSVRLLLATKTQDVEDVQAAIEADRLLSESTGRRPALLGENRVQEVTAKAPLLLAGPRPPELHLIGPLQSNKVNHALRWVTCVQSVASHDLAERLARRCTQIDRALDVMMQVNVSGEPTKHGVHPDEAVDLALQVAALDRLRLCGLMTIGARSPHEARVRAGFALLRELRDTVLTSGAPGTADAQALSMGMSGDLELAVAEGATIVRVGTDVFGTRPVPPR